MNDDLGVKRTILAPSMHTYNPLTLPACPASYLASLVLAAGTVLPWPLGLSLFSSPLQARAWVKGPRKIAAPQGRGRES